MANQRIVALDYIRGISMLGVLGIHTGAYSLTYPAVNPHLFALYEIVTRFSVPIFFFVSAFGLFISQPLSRDFHYPTFLSRRFKAVLLPYLTWSILYMLHYTWISGDTDLWHRPLIYEYFLFGLASYQLYFLVILIWFYALMPLWRQLVRFILKAPTVNLLGLLFVQIAFNYYSSYILKATYDNYYLNLAIQHRMNYLVFHYLFIFILGAVCAERYSQFLDFLKERNGRITICFFLTLIGMLSHYYYLVYHNQYTLEATANTVHQLSPLGVLYTVASCLFWFKIFSGPFPVYLTAPFKLLGKYSYLIYLIHPLVMYYLIVELNHMAKSLTPLTTICFYFATLIVSISLVFVINQIGQRIPLLSLLLSGSYANKNRLRGKS